MAPTYSINMRTIDRGERGRRNYLGDTLASLSRSGLFERDDFELVIWDSGSRETSFIDGALGQLPLTAATRAHVRRPEHRLTLNQNFTRSLRGGAESGADWVIVVEDDIVVVHDWLGCIDRWLERYFDEDEYRLASFYTPYDAVERIWVATGGRVGWWRYPPSAFYGTLCLAVRPTVARGIADTIDRVATGEWEGDVFVKQFFAPDEVFLASVPSFAQHVGDESSIQAGEWLRRCPCFPGEEWTW